MSEYKRNHTIPAFMLEYWVDENAQHKGVHVYDIKSKRVSFSTSQGKKRFSFAIIKNLYIHDSYAYRAVGLEKWFSKQETSLCKIVRQAHNRQSMEWITSLELTKILMGLVSLEHRSNYNINKIYKAIKEDKNLRDKISANPERPLDQLALENIVHIVTEQHLDFFPPEIIFSFAPKNYHWIICDRPFFNHAQYHFVILTNKVMASYKRSSEPTYRYMYNDLNNKDFETINKLFAMNAREWLVSKNKNDLDQYSILFDTDEWKESLKEEKLLYIPTNNLICGWTINK